MMVAALLIPKKKRKKRYLSAYLIGEKNVGEK